jgi:transcriptional regulator with XRE-family HTH domain
MSTFGATMLALMAERQLSLRKLSRIVHLDAGYLSRISRDLRVPSADTALLLDNALGADGHLAAFVETTPDNAGQRASVDSDRGNHIRGEEEDDMQRRRLLQALAALGVTSSPAFDALQQIRAGVDGALGREARSHVDEWEEAVAEYGFLYCELPPHLLMRDLATDLVAVQQITARTTQGSDALEAAWRRVAGGLAALMAKTLSNVGQARLAREWWVTAQHAADASGDTALAMWIQGERLVSGLYENRPRMLLLRQADDVIAASDGPASGVIGIRAVRAQLLAMEGAGDQAARELRACEQIFETLPYSVTHSSRTVHAWSEDRLRYTQAWVYAHTGERDGLDDAVDRAHQLLPPDDPRVHTQLSLLRACGHVRAGDATEGVKAAHAVYAAQPAEQRTTMVKSLAGLVLRAVPPSSHAEPPVIDYRELIASGSGRRFIT